MYHVCHHIPHGAFQRFLNGRADHRQVFESCQLRVLGKGTVDLFLEVASQCPAVGKITFPGRLSHTVGEPVCEHFPPGQHDVMLNALKQRRTPPDLVLDSAEYLQNNPVGQLFHKGFVIEDDKTIDPCVGKVDDLVLMQAVDDRHHPKNTQKTQASDRDAPHQVVPVDERVEVPAGIGSGFYRVRPAQDELAEEYGHKRQVVEDETLMYRVIEFVDGRRVFFQQALYANESIDRIPDDKPEVDDQQYQHQHIDDKPAELVAGFQIVPVYL